MMYQGMYVKEWHNVFRKQIIVNNKIHHGKIISLFYALLCGYFGNLSLFNISHKDYLLQWKRGPYIFTVRECWPKGFFLLHSNKVQWRNQTSVIFWTPVYPASLLFALFPYLLEKSLRDRVEISYEALSRWLAPNQRRWCLWHA